MLRYPVHTAEPGGTSQALRLKENVRCDSRAGPKRLDRVARFRQMQAIWAGDAFLKSGAAGANGAGELQAVLQAVIAFALLRITRDNYGDHCKTIAKSASHAPAKNTF